MDRDSSSRASSRKRVRGWKGLGSIKSIETCGGPGWPTSRAGALAAPLAFVAWGCIGAGSGELLGSSSRMSAPSPRPSAFLGIGNDLLGELRVAFSALAVNIVKNDWFSDTWCFCKPHISRYHALEDLRAKETAQISGNLAGKSRPLIVHGEQNTLDFAAWIEGSPDAHQGIQQFGDALKRQAVTLDTNQHGLGGIPAASA